ncbi:hypothetical protein J6590_073294 [Homalodisca vitripennis]|nr:hypothetical protein J6590_073294 [Homalodisca vitripennis]
MHNKPITGRKGSHRTGCDLWYFSTTVPLSAACYYAIGVGARIGARDISDRYFPDPIACLIVQRDLTLALVKGQSSQSGTFTPHCVNVFAENGTIHPHSNKKPEGRNFQDNPMTQLQRYNDTSRMTRLSDSGGHVLFFNVCPPSVDHNLRWKLFISHRSVRLNPQVVPSPRIISVDVTTPFVSTIQDHLRGIQVGQNQ